MNATVTTAKTKGRRVAQRWVDNHWLSKTAPSRDLFGGEIGLGLFEEVGADFDIETAAPLATVRGNTIEIASSPRCHALLTDLCDMARELGYTPTIWAGRVPGSAEVRIELA